MDDAKEIWGSIRTRFGGNANSKKMQKSVFKQQFETFTISSSEGLEKGYERFQQLLSQLEAHGAEVSTEDANHKFLRSLPPTWNPSTCTPSTSSTNILEKEALAGFADEIHDLDIEEMDINWQIAMIAIRMKKFYKKIGRRVRVDGKAPVGFDKKKLECFNCHNTGQFARELPQRGPHDERRRGDSFINTRSVKQEKTYGQADNG
ncbi:hypothetical protein Tco_0491189 [Tanacetum coccineum]